MTPTSPTWQQGEEERRVQNRIMVQTFLNQWVPGDGRLLTAIPGPLVSDCCVKISESALPNLGHTSESLGQVLKVARPGPYTSRDSG